MRTAVLLMSFGSAQTAGEVPEFLRRIIGREPSELETADLVHRYQLIGGHSPLLEITHKQAAQLHESLSDTGVVVKIAMRHSAPLIGEVVEEMVANGIQRIVAIPLAPQDSPDRSRYFQALREATRGRIELIPTPAWHKNGNFIAGVAAQTTAALGLLSQEATVLFTAHSLPSSLPGSYNYVEQLLETAREVAAAANLREQSWEVVFQSVPKHSKQQWLGPDLSKVILALAGCGNAIAVTPIQFISDHLEVLFDIDIAARRVADELNIPFVRAACLNEDPSLTRALEEVARTALNAAAIPA